MNVNPLILCGASGNVNGTLVTANNVRSNPSEYVNWDGIHLTDAADRISAQNFLTGRYIQPFYNLSSLCNLRFAQF